jgi:hypothetical protein
MKNRKLVIALAFVAVTTLSQFAVASMARVRKTQPTRFIVRVENISDPQGQTAQTGDRWPFALSPGMFVLTAKRGVLFREGEVAPANGLEAQAEDGNPTGLISGLDERHHASNLHGIFNTPVAAMEPGPIGPGAAYEFAFTASPKTKLFMALMFGQSNDLFYAPDESGISLFDSSGNPLSGDIAAELVLWDAGTEVNEELGVGPNQAPRQKSANTGTPENGVVTRARNVRFYGRNNELFRVTLSSQK